MWGELYTVRAVCVVSAYVRTLIVWQQTLILPGRKSHSQRCSHRGLFTCFTFTQDLLAYAPKRKTGIAKLDAFLTVFPQQARGCVELQQVAWQLRPPALPPSRVLAWEAGAGVTAGTWLDLPTVSHPVLQLHCIFGWRGTCRWVRISALDKSRPPRPHMLHGRLSLPLTPISIFPTTNSPRPHRQSQDQNTNSGYYCNNKINNTNPSLGRNSSFTLSQAITPYATPVLSKHCLTSPCYDPSDLDQHRRLHRNDIDISTPIHTDAGHRL